MTTLQLAASIADQIVKAIRTVVGPDPVALHEPEFLGNEWRYLKECLDSSFVSSVGKFVDRFENDLATYTDSKYAVALVNGTAALHIALKLAGVEPGDEVLVPALTFAATASAVMYCGAIPHFVESEESTLGMDAGKLRDYLRETTEQHSNCCVNCATGRIIRVLVPMHTFGHPVDISGVLTVAREFNLMVVEDAAESLGSFYQRQHTGTFGLMGTLSFNGNKTITTGGGGAILTNDTDLARRAKHLVTTAKIPHRWAYDHDEIGYNYRLPNLNAALGCAQLEQLPTLLFAKRQLFSRYEEAFLQINGVNLVSEPEHCSSNYWLQTLLLDPKNADHRDAILQATNDTGFMTRPAWKLINELLPYKDFPKMDLKVAQSLSLRIINLPSSSRITL